MGFLSDVVSPGWNFLRVGAKHVQSITAFVLHSNSGRKIKIKIRVFVLCRNQQKGCKRPQQAGKMQFCPTLMKMNRNCSDK